MNLFAVLALATGLLAWISMGFVLKRPALRRTMWPVWMLHTLAALLGVAAVAATGVTTVSASTICAFMALASFVLFLIVYVAMLRIPGANGRPESGQPLPDFEVKREDGSRVPVRSLLGHGPSLIVFFRGFWCLSCTDELMGLARVRDELKKSGGGILAISTDKLEVLLADKKRLSELPCRVVCDPGAAAVTALHLLQANMAKIGKKMAVPANLLIDENGIVRWTHYASIVMDRPDPQLVLEKVFALKEK